MLFKGINFVAVFTLLVAVVGCETKTVEHGHAAGPATFKEAAEQLVEMKNKIRDGFASGNVDAAHGPLHEVGHALEGMTSLAGKSDFSAEQKGAIEEAKETLFTAFGEIDKTLHGGEGSTYDDEAEKIDSAMKVILEAAGISDDAPAGSANSGDGLPAEGSGTVEDSGSGNAGGE